MDELWKILLGGLLTLLSTLAVDFFKRRNQKRDEDEQDEDKREKRCDRMSQVWGEMLFSMRHKEQQMQSLAALAETRPDYVLARIKEIAAEPSNYDRWEKYVDGN